MFYAIIKHIEHSMSRENMFYNKIKLKQNLNKCVN